MRLLDAGCGYAGRYSDFPGAVVTGIDIVPQVVEMNPGLDVRLVGDIESYELPDSYDVILCFDVVEHLEHPYRALDNLAAALAPGGEMRLSLPDVFSRKSLLAKFTPHWFHVWVYRHVFGFEAAGHPGYGPFPTYLRWSLREARLRRWAADRGLAVVSVFRDNGGLGSRPLLGRLAGRGCDIELRLKAG